MRKKEDLSDLLFESRNLEEGCWIAINNVASLNSDVFSSFSERINKSVDEVEPEFLKTLIELYLEAIEIAFDYTPKLGIGFKLSAVSGIKDLLPAIEQYRNLYGWTVARTSYKIAHLDRERGEPDNAITIVKTASDRARENGDFEGATLLLNVYASAIRDKRTDFDRAADIFAEALKECSRIKDPVRRLRAKVSLLNNSATNLYYAGYVEECFETLAKIRRDEYELDDPILLRVLSVVYGNSGLFVFGVGDIKEALKLIELSDGFSERVKRRDQLLRNMINKGLLYKETGIYDKAIGFLSDADKLNNDISANDENTAVISNLLGTIYKAQGRLDEAINRYREAQEASVEHDRLINHWGNAVYNEGLIYFEQGQNRKAEQKFLSALKTVKRVIKKHDTSQVYTMSLLGSAMVDLKKDSLLSSEDKITSVIETAKRTGNKVLEMFAKDHLAQVAYATGNYRRCIELANEAINSAVEQGHYEAEREMNIIKARAHYKAGELTAAIKAAENAAGAVYSRLDFVPPTLTTDMLTGFNLFPGSLKANLLKVKIPVLELLVELLVAGEFPEKALAVIEKVKETVIADLLALNDLKLILKYLPENIRTAFEELQLLEASTKRTPAAVRRSVGVIRGAGIGDYTKKRDKRRKELLKKYADFRNRVVSSKAPVDEEARTYDYDKILESLHAGNLLNDGTKIVNYYYTTSGVEGENLWAFIIGRSGFKYVKNPLAVNEASGLNSTIKRIREDYDIITTRLNRGRSPFGGVKTDVEIANHARELGRLYDVLVEPLAEYLFDEKRKKIIVVPYGLINGINLASVRSPKTGRYLAEDFEVSYVPSISLFYRIAQTRKRVVNKKLYFAGIDLGTNHLAKEYEDIYDIYKKRRCAFVGSVYPSIPVNEFNEMTRGASLLHFSGHGRTLSEKPWESYIDFGDTTITVEEIFFGRIGGFDLELAFLNGCQTGSAGTDNLGLFSLGFGLLSAGARRIIATLWRVEDEAAATFAGRFHGYYAYNGDAALSLAETQRDFIYGRLPSLPNKRVEELKHPYYWAPYILIGLP